MGYFETVAGGENHAFLKHGSKWTELVPPQGFAPDAFAISNSGEVLGHYSTDNGVFTYVYKDGHYTTLRAKSGAAFTVGFAINKYGSIVGYFENGNDYDAYTYKNGVFYTYAYPAPTGTILMTLYTGINDLGDRVGYASLFSGGTQGFLMKCR